jgi:hypothetical protein
MSAADAAEIARKVSALTTVVEALQKEVAAIKAGQAAKPVTAGPQSPTTVPPRPAAPAAHLAPQARQAAKKQEEIITYAAPKANYCVRGLVGNRVFLAKINPDGSEVESTAVEGDRIEGVPVLKIDPAKREVQLAGGAKIGVAGPGCNRG